MRKNRYIPYGYTMKNGRLVIEKSEADVIRAIYEQYVGGSSLKEIADRLTKEKVPYSEKKTDWGKARVARIIENTKYLGEDEYDKIVDDSLFYTAAAVKAERLTAVPGNLNAEISVIKNQIRCIRCDYPMSRKSSKKIKTGAEWTYLNPECGCRVKISDTDLLEIIMRILKRIKSNETLLNDVDRRDDKAVSELKKQLKERLESGNASEEEALQLILQIASEQYNQISLSSAHKSEEIKRKIRRIEISEGFEPELFRAITSCVRIGDGRIELISRNNIQIGDTYGDYKDTEKDSDANNST